MAMNGQWKTMEAVMAGVIMLLFLAALNATSSQVFSPSPPHAHRALQALDDMGALRGPAYDMDAAAVDSLAGATGYLSGFNHTVQICNEAGSCVGERPDREDVWAYSFLMAGEDAYEPLEVVLYVFRGR
jgi:hypothetical protein